MTQLPAMSEGVIATIERCLCAQYFGEIALAADDVVQAIGTFSNAAHSEGRLIAESVAVALRRGVREAEAHLSVQASIGTLSGEVIEVLQDMQVALANITTQSGARGLFADSQGEKLQAGIETARARLAKVDPMLRRIHQDSRAREGLGTEIGGEEFS